MDSTELGERSRSSVPVWRAVRQFMVLFCCCLAFGLVLRWPGLSFNYFCWDEHDYIAHNIYARCSLGHFEIPYSNKWPLGHAIVYLLTRPFSPFSIVPYRIAMLIVDAMSAALMGSWLGNGVFRKRVTLALLYLLVSSVCLRLSPGIIAENMANLPLIGAVVILVAARRSSLIWPLSILWLAAACLVKPTAVLPGLGIIVGYLYSQAGDSKSRRLTDLIQIGVWSFIILAMILGLYWFNIWNAQHYFWRSAVIYNTSGAVFGKRPLSAYADVLFAGFAFFQYLVPGIVLALIALIHFRDPQTNDAQKRIMWIAIGFAFGALASLLIRPTGAQTTYWLYLLPPLFAMAISGYERLVFRRGRELSTAITALSLVPLIYPWAVFVYGQPKGVAFGGHGGLRVHQTQVEEIVPAVRAVTSHPAYMPEKSRVLVWDIPWQFPYFARAVPASSILTNETWDFLVDRPWQAQELSADLAGADFVVTSKSEDPDWLKGVLSVNFVLILEGDRQNVYARATRRPVLPRR